MDETGVGLKSYKTGGRLSRTAPYPWLRGALQAGQPPHAGLGLQPAGALLRADPHWSSVERQKGSGRPARPWAVVRRHEQESRSRRGQRSRVAHLQFLCAALGAAAGVRRARPSSPSELFGALRHPPEPSGTARYSKGFSNFNHEPVRADTARLHARRQPFIRLSPGEEQSEVCVQQGPLVGAWPELT